MELHSKTYTNEKLARLGIIDSEKCLTCLKPETINHLYYECDRTKEIAFNVFSLIKHFIYSKRNEPLQLPSLEAMITNRIGDINIINWKHRAKSQNKLQEE